MSILKDLSTKPYRHAVVVGIFRDKERGHFFAGDCVMHNTLRVRHSDTTVSLNEFCGHDIVFVGWIDLDDWNQLINNVVRGTISLEETPQTLKKTPLFSDRPRFSESSTTRSLVILGPYDLDNQ